MPIQLTPETEAALAELARARGTTPDLLVEEYVREHLRPNGTAGDESQSLADFIADHIGVLGSGEYVPGGANLSEDTGKRFTEALVRQRRQGRL